MIFENYNFYKIQNLNPLIIDLGELRKITGVLYKNEFKSNPFFTFGGITNINNMSDLFQSINVLKIFFKENNVNSLKINFPPSTYKFINLIQIDYLRSLFEKFKISKINYYFTIPNNSRISKSKIRFFKNKNISSYVSINNVEDLKKSYFIIHDNLKRKYNVSPVHNLNTILDLLNYFTKSIDWFVYKNDQTYYAILVFFKYGNVAHCQYSCSVNDSNKLYPLDNLIAVAISKYREDNMTLSLGRVNDNSKNLLNYELAEFKRRWGGLAEPGLEIEYNTIR